MNGVYLRVPFPIVRCVATAYDPKRICFTTQFQGISSYFFQYILRHKGVRRRWIRKQEAASVLQLKVRCVRDERPGDEVELPIWIGSWAAIGALWEL